MIFMKLGLWAASQRGTESTQSNNSKHYIFLALK